MSTATIDSALLARARAVVVGPRTAYADQQTAHEQATFPRGRRFPVPSAGVR